jgi:hypothetical protein
MYQPATARPARPAVVMIAAAIMWLMALLSLAATVATLAAIRGTEDAFRDMARRERLPPDEIETFVDTLRVGFICTAVVTVAFAVLLAVLAWGVMRGSQGARVTTWVVCGLGVLCACCTSLGSLASFSTANPANADPDQVAGNLMVRALPDWAANILLGSSGLNVLGYIATAVLLALPAANAFFRGARPAGWQPATYQQNPPYPPPPSHPSHPAPPGPPGGPGAASPGEPDTGWPGGPENREPPAPPPSNL